MKTRIRWAIGGGIAALIAALFIGLQGGMGTGSGTPSPEASTEEETAKPEAVSAYFTIEVNGSDIRVAGRSVDAETAVSEAKKDGRPVEVRWSGAYTDAEDALKKALRAADLSIARETR